MVSGDSHSGSSKECWGLWQTGEWCLLYGAAATQLQLIDAMWKCELLVATSCFKEGSNMVFFFNLFCFFIKQPDF